MVLDFADMVRFIVLPRSHDSPTDRSILYLGDELIVKEGGGPCRDYLNQTTKDWYTRFVTLSETKDLSERFFAALWRSDCGAGCCLKPTATPPRCGRRATWYAAAVIWYTNAPNSWPTFTISQYNLPEIGKKLADKANSEGVEEHCPDPSVRKTIEVDVSLINHYDKLLGKVELYITRSAKAHDGQTFARLQSVPGDRGNGALGQG